MPRVGRIDVGGYVYHVLNRANARVQVFDTKDDYAAFDRVLEEGVKKFDMCLLAYCIMPNHWHLVLSPRNNGDLSRFMGWVTNTHTRRWHAEKKTIGQGHLYQGRYKSFLCQKDEHLLALILYVERNAKQAKLVQRAKDWRWSSVWRRERGTPEEKKLLTLWPIDEPSNYVLLLDAPQAQGEEEALEHITRKNIPFGDASWVGRMVRKFGLQQTLREGGRPKNGG